MRCPHDWLQLLWLEPGVSNPQPMGRTRPRMAMNAAQHKIVNLLKTFFFAYQFLLEFVYLMCGPRQLFFFFQCDPEMPKVWTPMWPSQRRTRICHKSCLLVYIISSNWYHIPQGLRQTKASVHSKSYLLANDQSEDRCFLGIYRVWAIHAS